jgi:hypothetical protein
VDLIDFLILNLQYKNNKFEQMEDTALSFFNTMFDTIPLPFRQVPAEYKDLNESATN